MADATLSIATLPATAPVVADASTTVAATTASEAGADPFASLLATLAETSAPVATVAATPAVTPPAVPATALPTGPKDETAAPSSDPKTSDSDDDTAPDTDTLAAAIAAGATAVLAMAQTMPAPPPAPVPAKTTATQVVRAIATGATAKAADLPITKDPADPAQQTAQQGAANMSAAAQAAPATGQATAQPDAATITAILKALPIAAGTGANTDTPAPKKAEQIAKTAMATAQAQPRADHVPPPPLAAGHGAATTQPAPGKPARANDRRADAVDSVFPGLFAGPQHDATALSGDASGASQTAAPDSIVQQQLSIAQDGQWLDTLARDIAQTAGSGNDLHFKLDPQNLGSLTVSIAQGSDGAAIRMSTDSADTRAILIDAQPKLVAEARAQGLRISEAHVDLSQSNGGSRGGDTWNGSWGGQSNAQANGQGQQSSTGRQPFMRNPEPMLARGTGSQADPDELYA